MSIAGDVFNMEHLRAVVDRHSKHFSSEVERAWTDASTNLASFSFGGKMQSAANEELARGGDSDDDTATHRAGRKKKLSIGAITEMARRASQDSLAKLDDARFMERLKRRARQSDTDASEKDDSGETRRSTQDLQALIARSIPKAPSIPKWGEDWDVFKAISTNFNVDDADGDILSGSHEEEVDGGGKG
jgi:digalactosyldiacylglycerol synthase